MSNTADIRGLMQFANGQIQTLTLTPNGDKDPTASLRLSATLTPEVAAVMKCRDSVFDDHGKPRPQVTELRLKGVILRDIDLSLPSPENEGAFDLFRPEDIARFSINVDGMVATLSMLARIKNRYLDLVVFLQHNNTEKFEFAIRAMQGEFDWSGTGGEGERVSLSPPANQDGSGEAETKGPLFVVADLPREDFGVEAQANPERFRVPDVRDMGIKRSRKKLTRGDLADPNIESDWADVGSVEVQ